jgi:excisionase family DNA binding protein
VNDESLMTVQEVAEYLNLSDYTVRRMALDLGGIKIGQRLRFRRSSVDAYLKRHQLGAHQTGR